MLYVCVCGWVWASTSVCVWGGASTSVCGGGGQVLVCVGHTSIILYNLLKIFKF